MLKFFKSGAYCLGISFLVTAAGCGTSEVGEERGPLNSEQFEADGFGNETEGSTDQVSSQQSFSLYNSSTSYCPPNSILNTATKLCVEGTRALGPFPPAMISRCIEGGGGNVTCNGASWDANFAARLRGSNLCPNGTTLDESIQECVSGEQIYGPFSKSLVDYCLSVTSNSLACKTQRISKSIAVSFVKSQPAPIQKPAMKVRYFYQYHNYYEPSRTCNLTSVAMVANYLGVNVTPDQLYQRTGGPVFTGPDMVWAAGRVGLKGTYQSNANTNTIKAHIDAGKPVIIQGWFTRPGHIIVITGYDDKGWIVNDPSGMWAKCKYCGYPSRTSTNGIGARYSYAEMANAASDLGNPNSYWITVLSK